jgi:23S rRNA pseudoU1915 N3-methylase RlmH
MKLAVLAVGHRQPDWVNEGCAEYLKRMPRELPASVTEIKPDRVAPKPGNNCWRLKKLASAKPCGR